MRDELMEECAARIASLAGTLILAGDRTLSGDILARPRILFEQRLEVLGGESVDDHVPFRAGRIERRSRTVVAFDPEHVAGTTDITQLCGVARFIPQRHRALLDDEDVRSMRLALPEDVLIRLMEPDASAGGEGQKILLVHRVEGRVLLEEVGDA